jgi:histidinol dehydrogenase
VRFNLRLQRTRLFVHLTAFAMAVVGKLTGVLHCDWMPGLALGLFAGSSALVGHELYRRGVDRRVESAVASIVSDVRKRGDKAVLKYARRFDKLEGSIEITRDEIDELAARVPPTVRAALSAAARNIDRVARRQRPQGWKVTTSPGITVEQRVTPLDIVGCYVPGGRYPLPSSLLMTALPARAAGVREVIVACPHPAPVRSAHPQSAGRGLRARRHAP